MIEYDEDEFIPYLAPGFFIDSDAEEVVRFVRENAGGDASSKERALALYYAVRDKILYDPYRIAPDADTFKASHTLREGAGYCVAKAVVLAAVARAAGIPARIGFADVRNHLSTKRLRELMQTDVFAWHGYTELYLSGKWVKATPAFNLSLCEKFGVKPLAFDGESDSVFHPLDASGRRHMEYLADHGTFADVPFARMLAAYQERYPLLFEEMGIGACGDFEREASRET